MYLKGTHKGKGQWRIFFLFSSEGTKLQMLVLWNKLKARVLSNKRCLSRKIKAFVQIPATCFQMPRPGNLSNSWYNIGFALGLPRECFPIRDLPTVSFASIVSSFLLFPLPNVPLQSHSLKRQIPKALLSLDKMMISCPFEKCLPYNWS